MSVPRVLISAGEVSGDVVGAELVSRLRDLCPEVVTFGLGGSRMREAGCRIECETNSLATIGITEILRTGPSFLPAFRRIRRIIRATPPDVAVLISNDVFNVALARWLRRRGVPTIAYFPPVSWIHRAIAGPIGRSYDTILTSFPHEQLVYERSVPGGVVTYVGHYLAERLAVTTPAERAAARVRLGLAAGAPVVVLMPGSRVTEVRRIGRVLLDAAVDLVRAHPELQLVMPLAEEEHRVWVASEIARRPLAGGLRISDDSLGAMRAADVGVLASGTASLEAALLGVPTILVYMLSSISAVAIRAGVRAGLMPGDVGLPNLLLGRDAVPELLQEHCTRRTVTERVLEALSDPSRRAKMAKVSAELHGLLATPDCLGQVGQTILSVALAHMAQPSHVATPPLDGSPARLSK